MGSRIDSALFSSGERGNVQQGRQVTARLGFGLLTDFDKVQYAGGPVYTLDLLFFKLALLTSYLRIGGFVVAYRKIIIGVIAAVVLNQIICTLIMCLVCVPVSS